MRGILFEGLEWYVTSSEENPATHQKRKGKKKKTGLFLIIFENLAPMQHFKQRQTVSCTGAILNNASNPSKLILQGTANFRDLGGTPAPDGRVLGHGIIYRSEGPGHLTESDVELLRTVNFCTIFDLRSKGERLARPEYLEGALTSIDDLSGSVENYLKEHAGLSETRMQLLCDKLLVAS